MPELTLNGQTLSFEEGSTILQVAEKAGITIPTICYDKDLTPPGLCRLCIVEVEGARVLLPACITKGRHGMVIHSESPRVKRARKTILEMLASSSDLSRAPQLLDLLHKYGGQRDRFNDTDKLTYPVKDDNPFYIRDYSKCIVCGKCVQVCSEDIQFSYALTVSGRGYSSKISTFYDRELPQTSCVFCGNCIEVCPTKALISKKEYVSHENS